jgi:hypothetical protein
MSAFSLSLNRPEAVSVGNRLSLTTHEGVVNYQYDAGNRLTSVNGQAYTWDSNGNPSTSSGQAC